jgi:glycosyltransferase involved in cell wall biosynthesis
MRGRSVDLLLSELGSHDATSNHTRQMRDVLVEEGAEVRIVVQFATSDEPVTLLKDWKPTADLTVLQHAIGSGIADRVIRERVSAVVNYHNVTPPELVEAWDADLISGLRWGRSQLDQLAPVARGGLAVSEFNARDMRSAGFHDIRVAPVLWTMPAAAERERRDAPIKGGNVLFVGRVAPNKCHHDLIAAMAALSPRRPDAELVLVGSTASRRYERAVRRLAGRLGVGDRVHFTGAVSGSELASWYERADVFACLSAHEGFCVPVIEAMHHGLPVVAHRAAAVPETVSAAALLLGDKAPATTAAALDRVLSDAELQKSLRSAGYARAEDFAAPVSRLCNSQALAGFLEEDQ